MYVSMNMYVCMCVRRYVRTYVRGPEHSEITYQLRLIRDPDAIWESRFRLVISMATGAGNDVIRC